MSQEFKDRQTEPLSGLPRFVLELHEGLTPSILGLLCPAATQHLLPPPTRSF